MAVDSLVNAQTQYNDIKEHDDNQIIEQCAVLRCMEACIQTDSHNGSIQPILHHVHIYHSITIITALESFWNTDVSYIKSNEYNGNEFMQQKMCMNLSKSIYIPDLRIHPSLHTLRYQFLLCV